MKVLFKRLALGLVRRAEVPLNKLLPFHRTSFSKVAEYARMPRETYPPIFCKKNVDYYAIIDGHHRWKAAQRRGDATVRIEFI